MATGSSVVVVRFSPFSPEALIRNAESTYRWDIEQGSTSPRFGVSVRADRRRTDETQDAVARRLCLTARLGGLTVAVVTIEELHEAAFELWPDPDPADSLHALIGENDLSRMPDAVRLGALLATHKRPRPQPLEG